MGVRTWRWIVFLGIVILAAVLSPDGNVVSPIIVAGVLGAAFLAVVVFVDRRNRYRDPDA